MGESQTAVRETIERLYQILDNVHHLLNDVERELSDHGFSRLHTGFHANGSKVKPVALVPQHVTVFFGRENEEGEHEHERKSEVPFTGTLATSVILADNGSRALDPKLVGCVLRPRTMAKRYIPWWVQSVVTSDRLNFLPSSGLPEWATVKRGYTEADYWFDLAAYFSKPLTVIDSAKTLAAEFIPQLLELHHTMNGWTPEQNS